MKIIVGLGNPGKRYEGTRHNVGFMMIDSFVHELRIKNYELRRKFSSEIVQTEDLILAKPQTFVNQSGVAVSKLIKFFKVDLGDLYVVHDDLDIELGRYKIQLGKGPKIHNGLNSIYEKLGTKKFWHIRIGIDNRKIGDRTISGEKYVLQKFKNRDDLLLKKSLQSVVDELVSLFE